MICITVTEDDIQRGERMEVSACPVALALRRDLRVPDEIGLEVQYPGAVLYRFDGGEFWHILELPSAVNWWISRYDSGDVVSPISFEVDLPSPWRY